MHGATEGCYAQTGLLLSAVSYTGAVGGGAAHAVAELAVLRRQLAAAKSPPGGEDAGEGAAAASRPPAGGAGASGRVLHVTAAMWTATGRRTAAAARTRPTRTGRSPGGGWRRLCEEELGGNAAGALGPAVDIISAVARVRLWVVRGLAF